MRDGHACDRWNMLHPGGAAESAACVTAVPEGRTRGVFVAASDYLKALPDSIDKWLPRPLVAKRGCLTGTDCSGYGRSENRPGLREFFEVDYRYIVIATLGALAREKKIDVAVVEQAIKTHNINTEKSNPALS